MNPHLFVYGSLMRKARHPMGERLARQARHLGEAALQGRLYQIGRYPGLVEGPGGERVFGEVYALHDPARALRWLDAYEGLVAGSPHYGEYARCERPVRLARGAEISCWVYLYCKDVSGLPALADGRWVPKASRACKHAAQRQKLRASRR